MAQTSAHISTSEISLLEYPHSSQHVFHVHTSVPTLLSVGWREMHSRLPWVIGRPSGPLYTGNSMPDQTQRNIYIMQAVTILFNSVTDLRYMEIHTILDVHDFWRCVPGGWVMGMECLLFQIEMGYTDPHSLCCVRGIHSACQRDNCR